MHASNPGLCLTDRSQSFESQAVSWFSDHQSAQTNVETVLDQIGQIIDLSTGSRKVAVVGCGPKPSSVRRLLDLGYDAVGVEPVPGLAAAASQFLGDSRCVQIGTAESLPFVDASQQIILLECVLEHVDSPALSLQEAYRALQPGGLLYIYTTNRYRVSLTGYNGEYRIPFYNWFPPLLKESLVHKHLHHAPHLANYSLRPAVHWFSYSDLCRRGREVGFAQFYSKLDAMGARPGQGPKQRLVRLCAKSALLRTLALLQFGNSIFMWKRADSASNQPSGSLAAAA